MAVIAMLFTLAILPTSPATAQEGTPPPSGESELAPQLPAVDLPTMNEMGYTFEVDSAWNGSGSTPAELPVYRFEAKNYTEEEVRAIADQLGVGGELSAQGEGTYTVEGEGSIYTTPGMLQYVSNVEASDDEIPSDEEAVAYAREWLRIGNLLPANSDNGAVIAHIESPARKIVAFEPTSPAPLLSSTPGIAVTIGPGGSVLEARIAWATIEQGDMYLLRGADDAFGMVASRQSYLDVTLPSDAFPQGSTVKGVASYDNVTIAWSTSGVLGQTQYIQPIYVFTGQLTPEGADQSYDITSYVPAIVTGLQPVG
jgi:hypothetical protein